MIEVAEAIPFIALTNWDHGKLYELKGEVIRRGIKSVCQMEMPIFEKRRFQHGAMAEDRFQSLCPKDEADYRFEFLNAYQSNR